MTRKMNPEVKTAWVAALRSGEYKQGRDRLICKIGEDKFEHCCLGVLCELAVRAEVVQRLDLGDGLFAYKAVHSRFVEKFSPPPEVSDWAGVAVSEWYSKNGNTRGHGLMGLNDRRGLSFAQIADVIEEEL